MESQPIKKNNENSDILEKLDKIAIKSINFDEVPIDAAILFLKTESRKADPTGKGVNFFLKLEPPKPKPQEQKEAPLNLENAKPKNQHLITMAIDNISLRNAIDSICKSADLKYKISKYAIEIFSQNVNVADLYTEDRKSVV